MPTVSANPIIKVHSLILVQSAAGLKDSLLDKSHETLKAAVFRHQSSVSCIVNAGVRQIGPTDVIKWLTGSVGPRSESEDMTPTSHHGFHACS